MPKLNGVTMKSNSGLAARITIISILVVVSLVYFRRRAPSPLPPLTTQAVVPTKSLVTTESKITNLTTSPMTNATRRSDRSFTQLQLVKELVDLTDDQAKKLEPILQAQQKQLAAFRRETSLSRQQRVVRLQEMRATNDAQLQSVLTPEQFEKWRRRGLSLQQPNPPE